MIIQACWNLIKINSRCYRCERKLIDYFYDSRIQFQASYKTLCCNNEYISRSEITLFNLALAFALPASNHLHALSRPTRPAAFTGVFWRYWLGRLSVRMKIRCACSGAAIRVGGLWYVVVGGGSAMD